jgi:hypothetical protein
MFLVECADKVVVRELTRGESNNKIMKGIGDKDCKTRDTIRGIINASMEKG